MDGIHTTRTLHYLELRRTIGRLGAAKPSSHERELLLDASDAGLFGEPEAYRRRPRRSTSASRWPSPAA